MSVPSTTGAHEDPSVTDDPYDAQQVHDATGLSGDFNRAGVLAAADVHVASRLRRLTGESDESVLLAAALAVRAVRLGSVCVDISRARETTTVDDGAEDAGLAWPTPEAWIAALQRSRLVAVGGDAEAYEPLRLVDGVLYLDRYWRQQQTIAEAVDAAAVRPPPPVDDERMRGALDRLFGAGDADRQRLAAAVTARRWISVIAGGPGTGKTTTVAKLLAVLQDRPGQRLRTALAAPTGRASARLLEAVTSAAETLSPADRERLGELHASTLHRLLGSKPGARTRFRHDRSNPLPHDVVVVDEASMVSLTMMARLVDALRPDTRLVLVGDPDQLASVEAGAVLGDLVMREAPDNPDVASELSDLAGAELSALDATERRAVLTSGVVRLSHVFRFSDEIKALAESVRTGDVDAVLAQLDAGSSRISFVDAEEGVDAVREDAVRTGVAVTEAARDGDAVRAVDALERHRLLCAHRTGPSGVDRWSRRIEEWLEREIAGYGREGHWYIGRPLLVTANDYQSRLFNGDTGVVVDDGDRPVAAFRRDGSVDALATGRLPQVQTLHAMSVHRSQGSQFDRVTLVLPSVDSQILTRELFYTAITRAKERVRIVGSREAVEYAVRRPIVRASGLRTRTTP